MLLQTLSGGSIVSETPWHDAAANSGTYRERLKQYLGGYFEQDERGMQPKPGTALGSIPDAARLLDDDGNVIEQYGISELECEIGKPVSNP